MLKAQKQLAFHLFQVLHTHIYVYHHHEQLVAYLDDTLPESLKNVFDTYIEKLHQQKKSGNSRIFIQTIEHIDLQFVSYMDEDDLWIIGPFLEKTHTPQNVNQLIVMVKGNAQMGNFISNYYEHLPILEPFTIRFIHRLIETYQSYEDDEPIKYLKQIKSSKSIPLESIEKREEYRLYVKQNYEIENKLMNAIQHGDLTELKRELKEIRRFYLPERVPRDTLRNHKNNMVILNSLSTRKAIEGGLDIYHAHQISTMNAIRIEQLVSPLEVDNFTKEILFSFTEAVHLYQTKGYPHLIKETLFYIHRHITEPLMLSDIAKAMFVTPEHLSRMVKKYVGHTIHDLIMLAKMDEAKKMIAQQELTMIDIAHILGFSSSSHFSTIFSKYHGKSPKAYQKELMVLS